MFRPIVAFIRYIQIFTFTLLVLSAIPPYTGQCLHIGSVLIKYTVPHNHSFRHHTLSTQGQVMEIQHTPHIHRPNTQPKHQYKAIEKSHNKRMQLAATLVNTKNLTTQDTRDTNNEKKKNIYIPFNT
jgi:hypothetical protein